MHCLPKKKKKSFRQKFQVSLPDVILYDKPFLRKVVVFGSNFMKVKLEVTLARQGPKMNPPLLTANKK
jgi:hypothetical protein